jgi:hypothetical protein
MQSIARRLLVVAAGLLLVACFNNTKTTHVTPGVTNPQPVYSCQPRGGVCRTNADCCTQWCVNGTCVQQ